MLSKERAVALADEVLATERAARPRRADAREAPRHLRLPALMALAPERRALLVAEATRQTTASPLFWCAAIGWLALAVIATRVAADPAVGPAFLLGACGISLTRLLLLRRRLAALLTREQGVAGADRAPA